jgi:hypothetical protein
MELNVKAKILGQLWVEFRSDEDFKAFMEYNDIGCPLAYMVAEGIVKELSAVGEEMIGETFKMLISLLETTEDELDLLPEINLVTVLQHCYKAKNGNNVSEISMQDWVAAFKPIVNPIDKFAEYDNGDGGTMFADFGDELEFIKQQDPACTWTYGEATDGCTYIQNGWKPENTLGHFVTEIPSNVDSQVKVKVSNYWFYCGGCNTDMEDEGKVIWSKFSDWECCPLCATSEQLKEIDEANS